MFKGFFFNLLKIAILSSLTDIIHNIFLKSYIFPKQKTKSEKSDIILHFGKIPSFWTELKQFLTSASESSAVIPCFD